MPSGGGYHDVSLKSFGGVCVEMYRCQDAKRHRLLRFELFKKIDKFLSLNFRNILISPLEGEKKFLGELNELRNFREGYNLKYSCPVQHETVLEPSPAFVMLTKVRKRLFPLTKREGCDSVISSDFKSKISITNENNLPRKELSAQVPQYLSNFSETVFSRFTSHFSRKRIAFTLAEVLITLGIIGIVAALTLPTLIARYQEKVLTNKYLHFYSLLENAYRLVQNEYGTYENWYGSTGDNKDMDIYNFMIKPYFKLNEDVKWIRIKGTTTCMPEKSYWLDGTPYSSNLNGELYRAMHPTVNLASGECLALGNANATGSYFFVDLNGKKAPNTFGKDQFIFSFDAKKNERIKPGPSNAWWTDTADYCDINSNHGWNAGSSCGFWIVRHRNMDYLHLPFEQVKANWRGGWW